VRKLQSLIAKPCVKPWKNERFSKKTGYFRSKNVHFHPLQLKIAYEALASSRFPNRASAPASPSRTKANFVIITINYNKRRLMPSSRRVAVVSRETKQERNWVVQKRFHPIEFIFTRRDSGDDRAPLRPWITALS
jgi:hypothetical protein